MAINSKRTLPLPGSLGALRCEIDHLDDTILDLVEQRLVVSATIAVLKQAEGSNRLKLRPRREAAIIERLVSRATLAPPGLVSGMWRTLMSYGLHAQTPTEIVLCAARFPGELLERTRFHFGPAAAIRWAAHPAEAIYAASRSEAIAVIEDDLPYSLEDERLLAFDTLHRADGSQLAVAIGRVAPEDVVTPTDRCPRLPGAVAPGRATA